MKVAVFSESSADEAMLRVLIDAVLGIATEPVDPPPLRTRGWPSVWQQLPGVMKHLHYHTDAEALVLVVDSNGSPIHQADHDALGPGETRCRMCLLQRTIRQVLQQLRPVAGKPLLKCALSLAVPTIEAWCLLGKHPLVGEATWASGLASGNLPYTNNSLKQSLYGTERPSLDLQTKRMVEEAHRLATDLAAMERSFPSGFASLLRDLRNW